MTVTYVQHIPNSGCWGFYRILAKWRGSLYKVEKYLLKIILIQNSTFLRLQKNYLL